jgi:hypothetical protein
MVFVSPLLSGCTAKTLLPHSCPSPGSPWPAKIIRGISLFLFPLFFAHWIQTLTVSHPCEQLELNIWLCGSVEKHRILPVLLLLCCVFPVCNLFLFIASMKMHFNWKEEFYVIAAESHHVRLNSNWWICKDMARLLHLRLDWHAKARSKVFPQIIGLFCCILCLLLLFLLHIE